jgi:hypothetical protein
MQTVLTKANWIVRDLTEEDDQVVASQLLDLIKRAQEPVQKLDSLLRNHIIQNYPDIGSQNSHQIDFAKKAWLKEYRKARQLQLDIRESRKSIDSALVLLCA